MLGTVRDAGATFSHFLPTRISVVFDNSEAEVNRLVAFFNIPQRYLGRDIEITEPEFPSHLFNQEVVRIVKEATLSTFSESSGSIRFPRRTQDFLARLEQEDSLSADDLLQLYRGLPGSALASGARNISERTEEIRTAARAGRAAEYRLRYAPLPDPLSVAADSIQQFFASSVKYLGPLEGSLSFRLIVDHR